MAAQPKKKPSKVDLMDEKAVRTLLAERFPGMDRRTLDQAQEYVMALQCRADDPLDQDFGDIDAGLARDIAKLVDEVSPPPRKKRKNRASSIVQSMEE